MTTDNKTAASYSERYQQQRLAPETGSDSDRDSAAPATGSYAERYAQGLLTSSPAIESPQPEVSPDQPTTETTEEAQENDTSETAAEVRIELEARASQVALSRKAEKQLAGNARELEMLQTNLAATGQQVKSLCFTSCFDGEGKTTAALNAAYGLASSGKNRVLLVDANIRSPRLHKLFSSQLQPGLNDILSSSCELEDALHPSAYPGLDFISAGEGPETSLGSEELEKFLEVVERAYDYIIIDSSAIMTSSEMSRIAPLFDGLVLVVACEQTKWDVAMNATEKIKNVGGEVIGVALNKRRFYIPERIYRWISR